MPGLASHIKKAQDEVIYDYWAEDPNNIGSDYRIQQQPLFYDILWAYSILTLRFTFYKLEHYTIQ